MSRIGKKPVAVPSGVTATVEGKTVKMKGPKGQLQFVVHDDVDVKFENTTLKGRGRHDPCVLPRAVPMVEAMTALVLVDHALRQQAVG